MRVIGLDAGTTAVKALAVDLEHGHRTRSVREYPLLRPQAGWQVQDAGAVVGEAVRALAEVVSHGGGGTVAVSLSAAMHGLVGLDRTGRPVTPLLTWADSRAAAETAALRTAGLGPELLALTGTPVHPMSPLAKLAWFARHEPELAARVHRWVGLKELLVQRLTGVLATELSSASGTGLLDLRTRAWSAYAADLAGVRLDQLPPVLRTTDALPLSRDAAAAVGLPVGTPVVLGAADGPLGNLGSGAVAPGVAGLSLGTSGAVRAMVPAPLADPTGRLFCYALTEDLWAVGGAVSNGGSLLRWAAGTVGATTAGRSDAEVLADAARVPPGSDGLTMLPYVLAERAPLWAPDIPGAYLGIRAGHTGAHFVRAAVEGVALQLAVLTRALADVTPVRRVHLTGGAFRSRLWADTVAAALDVPSVLVGAEEGSALGAAALGMCGVGLADGVAEAAARLTGSLPLETLVVDADVRTALDDVRGRVGPLVAGLAAVAGLLAPVSGSARTPAAARAA